MKSGIAILLALMAVFSGCGNAKRKPLSQAKEQVWLHLGDSISTAAQHTLLQYVSDAVQQGGFEHAVDFCNANAIPITDSISRQYTAYIQRLSDKSRNPDNIIRSDVDRAAWAKIHEMNEDVDGKPVQLVQQDDEGNVYYYKSILIGMPTCLKCHGDKTVDIASGVLRVIHERYPEDRATGYAMGELRGMWKIKLTAGAN